MKKAFMLFFLLVTGLTINSCDALHGAYHVGEAVHYVGYGGLYPYRNMPLVHSTFWAEGHSYCKRDCPLTSGHTYYRVPAGHSQYLGNDGYYYCYENCNAVGTHTRTTLIINEPHRRQDVYREARDSNYYRGYYRADYEYRKTLHNQAPVIRYHQPLRRRVSW